MKFVTASALLLFLCIAVQVMCQENFYAVNPSFLYAARIAPFAASPVTRIFNPSVPGSGKNFSSVLFAEKRYGLHDLKHGIVAISGAGENHVISGMLQYFGNTDYNQISISGAAGLSLGKINIGTTLRCFAIKNFPEKTQIVIQSVVSTHLSLAEGVSACFQLTNPQLLIATSKSNLASPAGGSLAFGYETSDELYIGVESMKIEGKPPLFFVALQFRPTAYFSLNGHWSPIYRQFFIGSSFAWQGVRIEIGSSFHADLGGSPAVMLIYDKKSQKPVKATK